jgi:hypothetical protein
MDNQTELPQVKLIPLKTTWTCPRCGFQNIYTEGIVSDPQNECGNCAQQVTIGAANDKRLERLRHWLDSPSSTSVPGEVRDDIAALLDAPSQATAVAVAQKELDAAQSGTRGMVKEFELGAAYAALTIRDGILALSGQAEGKLTGPVGLKFSVHHEGEFAVDDYPYETEEEAGDLKSALRSIRDSNESDLGVYAKFCEQTAREVLSGEEAGRAEGVYVDYETDPDTGEVFTVQKVAPLVPAVAEGDRVIRPDTVPAPRDARTNDLLIRLRAIRDRALSLDDARWLARKAITDWVESGENAASTQPVSQEEEE